MKEYENKRGGREGKRARDRRVKDATLKASVFKRRSSIPMLVYHHHTVILYMTTQIIYIFIQF